MIRVHSVCLAGSTQVCLNLGQPLTTSNWFHCYFCYYMHTSEPLHELDTVQDSFAHCEISRLIGFTSPDQYRLTQLEYNSWILKKSLFWACNVSNRVSFGLTQISHDIERTRTHWGYSGTQIQHTQSNYKEHWAFLIVAFGKCSGLFIPIFMYNLGVKSYSEQ